jgi:hypothetical protein
MNAEQMRSTLGAFADLVGGGGAEYLNRFAKLFEGLGTAKVAAIVGTIEGNWKSSNRNAGYPSELRKAIADIQQAFERSGAKAQAGAFTALLRLFVGADNQSVDAFVAEAIASRVKQGRSRSTTRAATPFTKEQARSLANQLASAADDRNRFDSLLDELKSQLKVAELKTIAGYYLGHETTKTKKDDIVKTMRHWHRQDELNRDRRASQAKTGL